MATVTNQFRPDYTVPPGRILQERLGAESISHAEFARRCGRSAKLISEIIAGKAPLEPSTALQFEKVLGVDASVWLGLETDYQLHRAREKETSQIARSVEWAGAFPIKELVKRGAILAPRSESDALSKLLTFFRVGSIKAWQLRYGKENAAYRHSPSFKSDEVALATWLRLGEIQADEQECSEYNETEFKRALREIRHCTRAPIEESVSHVRQLCNRSGVALALIKPLPKTALSGAAKWLTPRKALIQLSARHNTDDHLWFSFYHEAAHILLHSKKNVFVDDMKQGNSKIEIEADDWAAKMLVPRSQWKRFVTSNFRSRRAVCAFAEELGIAPGIVVGMLQHQGLLPWSHLNGLKVRYRWKDD